MKPDFEHQHAAAIAYRDKCLAYGKAHGLSPDGYPVISRKDHPREWQAWRDYCRSHGLLASLDLMGEDRNGKTVPVHNPIDFEEWGNPKSRRGQP